MSGKLPLGSEKRPTVEGGSSSVSWGNGRQMSKKKQQASPAKALHPRLILHDTAISMYIAGIPRYTP